MKKIVRLTENDLTRIVKKVINEQEDIDFDQFLDADGNLDPSIHSTEKYKQFLNNLGAPSNPNYNRVEPKKRKSSKVGKSNQIDLSGEQMDMLPDLSDSNAREIFANGCGLNTLPPVEHLPQSLMYLGLSDNDITEADMEGYRDLPNLEVIILKDNPIQWINWEEIENMPGLIRLAGVSGADNYDRELATQYSHEGTYIGEF
jgi:Leucine-rich repeat (LRR) protein